MEIKIERSKLMLKRKDQTYTASYCIYKGQKKHTPLMLSALNEKEKSHYDTLKYEKRKSDYLIGRYTAKIAVNELLRIDLKSIQIDNGIFNFPIVRGKQIRNVQVTLTHCEDISIAIAFPEDHPIGVDLEKIDRNKMKLVKEIVNEKELALQEELNEFEMFTSLWTVKEALSKILKTGFTCNLQVFEVEKFNKTMFFFESKFLNFMQYKGYTIKKDEYICSIVLPLRTQLKLNNFNQSLIRII